MKSFVAAVAFLAIISQINADCNEEERRIEMKKFHMHLKECAEEYELPKDRFRRIPDDKKCFYKCILVKEKLIDEEGNVDFDRFKESHKCMPEEMLESNKKCVESVEESEPCEKAKKIGQCIKKDMKKHHEVIRKVMEECAKEYDIPREVFRKHLPIPDDKICFYKCVAVKLHMMNEDGEFTLEEFKKTHKNIPKKLMRDFEECADETDDDSEDACEVARDFGECVKERMPHHGHHGPHHFHHERFNKTEQDNE